MWDCQVKEREKMGAKEKRVAGLSRGGVVTGV
jgi:hypothetical protein